MALYYNLSKVYFNADNDDEFVLKTLRIFIDVAPKLLTELKNCIEQKNYFLVEKLAAENQSKLELFGMTSAFEEIVLIQLWANRQGKRKEIKETYKSLENRVEKAVKEIKKDFKL
jgi:hypothetical protein